jgi:hypothetical protein
MRLALVAPALWLALGCKKPTPDVVADASVSSATPDVALREESPRCTLTEKAILAEPGESLDFGEGLAIQGGAVLGVSRASHGLRKAAVARVAPHVPARIVDLGAISGDDPPPKPFVRGAETFAAGYVEVLGDGGARAKRAGRQLTVFKVNDAPEPLVTVPQQSDESPAFDAVALPVGSSAGALLVWDEDAAADAGAEPPRGIIRAALLAPDLRTVTQIGTVSPDITDAERPRVALRDGGFWLAWIAERREPPKDAGQELEAPGEDRAYRWVELLALDEHARPAGAVRRLSSGSGHVAGFDMVGSASRLDAAIVLDDERTEGEGGEIVHVVAMAEGAPRVVPVHPSGAARGTAPWLGWASGSPGWLGYVDTSDHTRLVPLDADGAPAGADSIEAVLDEARPVAAPGANGVLAVSPGAGSVRWLSCHY